MDELRKIMGLDNNINVNIKENSIKKTEFLKHLLPRSFIARTTRKRLTFHD